VGGLEEHPLEARQDLIALAVWEHLELELQERRLELGGEIQNPPLLARRLRLRAGEVVPLWAARRAWSCADRARTFGWSNTRSLHENPICFFSRPTSSAIISESTPS
jgi:hypothetical protein